MYTPYPHQLELAERGETLLKKHGLVYLAMEERTGKSLTALLIAENCMNISKVLIITKLGANRKTINGWHETLANYPVLLRYEVINYHSAHKINFTPDLVILDEPHAYISGYPKPSQMWKKINKICKNKPIIYLSATPYAQGAQVLFHQLKLSTWSPWAHFDNFYKWFEKYALRDKNNRLPTQYIASGTEVMDYKKVQHEKALKDVEHLFISYTREEAGFEHEPEDVKHYIELDETTKAVYNHILKHKVLDFHHSASGKDYLVTCDTPMKLRTTLHQIEGGALKVFENVTNSKGIKVNKPVYLTLANIEKVRFILKHFGDNKNVAIMYRYKAEKEKLEAIFKNAHVLQADTNAEGVDLSHVEHLVIYSQDFSTAKHSQRRARQANMKRETPIRVHFLLVQKAVSEQVYKTVSENKTDFVDSVFNREELI